MPAGVAEEPPVLGVPAPVVVVVVLALDVVVLVLAPDAAVPPPVDEAAVGVELLPPQAASSPARTPAVPPAASPRSTVRRLNLPLRLATRPRSSLIIHPPPNDAIGHQPHSDRSSRSVWQTTADNSASITLPYDVQYGVGGTVASTIAQQRCRPAEGKRICPRRQLSFSFRETDDAGIATTTIGQTTWDYGHYICPRLSCQQHRPDPW